MSVISQHRLITLPVKSLKIGILSVVLSLGCFGIFPVAFDHLGGVLLGH
jgi:hypothetical protein